MFCRISIINRIEKRNEVIKKCELKEPKNSLTKQYKRLFEFESVKLEFREDALAEIAKKVNLDPLYVLSFYYVFHLLGEIRIQQNNPLRQYYQRAIEQDYFQLLSLDYEASQEQIKTAWQTHRQWLNQQNSRNHKQIKILTSILDDAYRILAYETLKKRYLQALKQPVYTPESIMPRHVDSHHSLI